MDDVLALEEDVTDDGETDALVTLDTTEAGAAASGRVVDVVARNGALDAANDEGEVGQGGGAGEDVAAVARAVLRILDLLVVGTNDVGRQVDKSSASVGDGVDVSGLGLARTDDKAIGLELPEAVRRIDIDVGDISSVPALNDHAEVVRTHFALLEGDGEQLLGKRRANSVEERFLRRWLNSVDAGESKAQKAIAVDVLGEGGGDGGGGLDGLGGGSHTTHNHLVGVDGTRSTGAIAVRDVPRGAFHLGARLGGIVDGVAGLLVGGHQGGEDPTTKPLARCMTDDEIQ